jgi:hypothetical protein
MDEKALEELDVSKYSYGIYVPEDMEYEHVLYKGSGRIVAERIIEYLSKKTSSVVEIDEIEGAFESCNESGVKYLIVPFITQWTDRDLNFSGYRDEVEIKLDIYDTGSARKVNFVVFRSISPWWAFAGKKTEDMLGEDFEKAVLKLLFIQTEE